MFSNNVLIQSTSPDAQQRMLTNVLLYGIATILCLVLDFVDTTTKNYSYSLDFPSIFRPL